MNKLIQHYYKTITRNLFLTIVISLSYWLFSGMKTISTIFQPQSTKMVSTKKSVFFPTSFKSWLYLQFGLLQQYEVSTSLGCYLYNTYVTGSFYTQVLDICQVVSVHCGKVYTFCLAPLVFYEGSFEDSCGW